MNSHTDPDSQSVPRNKRLFVSSWMFEHPIGENWVLFAPDRAGLPIAVDSFTRQLLHEFRNGATPEAVLAGMRLDTRGDTNFDEVTALIELLHARGFLTAGRADTRHQVAPATHETPTMLPVWFHVTNECNLDCSYCYVDKSSRPMDRAVADEAVRRIAHTAVKWGMREVLLKFAGGEPMLSLATAESVHSQLEELLDAESIQLTAGIITNGTRVNQRLIDFLKRPNTGISVSIDGFSSGHDRYRVFKHSRSGSWDVIMRNIDTLQAAGIKPQILTTLGYDAVETLPRLVEWVVENELKIRVAVVRESRRMRERSGLSWTDSDGYVKRLQAAFEEALSLLEQPDRHVDLSNGLQIGDLHFDKPEYRSLCAAGRSYVVINERGQLARCQMSLHARTTPATDDLLTAVRDSFGFTSFERNGEAGERCLRCRWFPVCVSGCPVHNECERGRSFVTSPLCAHYEFVIPRYVTFFGRKLIQASRRHGLEAFRVLTHSER